MSCIHASCSPSSSCKQDHPWCFPAWQRNKHKDCPEDPGPGQGALPLPRGPWPHPGGPAPAQWALAPPRGSWICNARMRAKYIHFFVLDNKISLPSCFWTSGTFGWDNPTPQFLTPCHPSRQRLSLVLFYIFPLRSLSKHQFLPIRFAH